ncbi:TetR/AcrR family transcriptional regulator [Streptomyces sp. SCA2-4]|nr:TetR/AcrR family transcriptional regulator [Streptomyces huiliensis]
MSAFWEKGYAGTSAQDLVESTGLGRGSLYHTFKSKHDLFEAALRRYDTEWTSRLVGILEDGDTPAADRIRAVLMSVVEEETAGVPGRRGCLVVNSAVELAGRDPEITDLVRDTFARVTDALTACVEEGHRDGTVDDRRAARPLALYLLNSLYGLRVLGKGTDRATLTGIVDQVMTSLR